VKSVSGWLYYKNQTKSSTSHSLHQNDRHRDMSAVGSGSGNF